MRIWIAAIAALAAVLGAQQAVAQARGKPLPDGRVPMVYLYDTSYEYPYDPLLMRIAGTGEPFPRWLKPSDYPQSAIETGITGNVTVELQIASDDTILGCRIVEERSVAELAPILCPVLRKRGSFKHALTIDGRPIAGKVLVTGNFDVKVPSKPDEPITVLSMPSPWAKQAALVEPKALVVRKASRAVFVNSKPSISLRISDAGTVSACTIDVGTGTDKGDIQLCRYASAARFTPALTSSGQAIASELLYLEPKIIR